MTTVAAPRRISISTVTRRGILCVYGLIASAPLLLMLINSARSSQEMFTDPLGLPTTINVSNYRRAWADASFSSYFLNSVIITVAAVGLCTVFALLAAYPLGRWKFRGGPLVTSYFLAGLLLPSQLGIVPIFYMLQSVGLNDSRLGLALVYAAGGLPIAVFILTAFFRGLPNELDEAGRIDGAGEFRLFAKVMVPLVRPAVATVAVFQFAPVWNDFFMPLILLRTSSKFTLPVGLTNFFGEHQADWGPVFAGLVITALPLIVLFIFASKQIVAGLTAGITK
jgi:raffinose/stachyose/melibiose transport system permease protein